MTRFLLLALLLVSSTASAIVIRDDVHDSKYRVSASAFPALVDLPHEGHGVLIAPQWVVTGAHAVTWRSELKQVVLDGTPRDVERLVVHPGFKELPHDLMQQARATGDATLVMALFATLDDIALIKLTKPVTDVAPASVYRSSAQVGQAIKFLGNGLTGTGASGHASPGDPRRKQLRRAFNKITSAHDRWFCYVFDKPPSALPLEGVATDGDSGGPVLVEVDGQWMLTGLTSWKVVQGEAVQGNAAVFRPGRYGQIMCNVNLNHYINWIESVIHAKP